MGQMFRFFSPVSAGWEGLFLAGKLHQYMGVGYIPLMMPQCNEKFSNAAGISYFIKWMA